MRNYYKVVVAALLVSGCASTISTTTSTADTTLPQLPPEYVPGSGRVEAVEAWSDRVLPKHYKDAYKGKRGTSNGVPYIEDRSNNQITRISVNKDWIVCEVTTTIPNNFENWDKRGNVYYSGKLEAMVELDSIRYTNTDHHCNFQV